MAGPEQTNVIKQQAKETAKALGEFRKKHLASQACEEGITICGSRPSEVIRLQAEVTDRAVQDILARANSKGVDGRTTSPAEAQARATSAMVRSIEQKKGK